MKASIHVLGANGYVWDAEVAHWLRLECGLVGAMVGGVASFKQQNAVHGLPLELSPEEVTLALERGWGELQPGLGMGELAARLAAAGRKRGREEPASAYQCYDSEEEEEGGPEDDAAMQDAQQQQQQQQPAWQAALAAGTSFAVPTTREQAAAADAGNSGDAPGGMDEAAPPEWRFPATQQERHRYWIFRDLHAKGYRLTGGSKFGADFLVYPGDPTLYHAQFCVRLLPLDQALLPVMLSSATRGSHQARKHLLIASVEEDGPESAACGQAAAAAVGNGQAAAAADGQAAAADGQAAAASACGQAQPSGGQQAAGEEGGTAGVQPTGGEAGAGPRIGANSRGRGSGGERFWVRYTTIGPVEGFG